MTGRRATTSGPAAGHLSDDRCLDLVHGLLEPEERIACLEHARRCALCESRLATHVDALERARRRMPDPLEAADRPVAIVAPRRPGAPGMPRGDRRFRIALAAAAALVASSVLLLTSAPGRSPLLSELARLPSAEEWIVVRNAGEMAAAPQALVEALDHYSRGDDRTAVRLLRDVTTTGRHEPLRRAYLGSALAHLGRLEDARRTLAALRPGELPEPWGDEVAWTQAVLALATRRREEGDSLLSVLASRGGGMARRVEQLRQRDAGIAP